MNKDNLPKKSTFWMLFDVDNGHEPTKHYCWWFNAYRHAQSFKKWHKTREFAATLVGPVKVNIDKNFKKYER